ncbi:cytochrome P450 2C23-like, partial [Ascaphus truei]|uniref:cytochrome P450 2C23-like n=1 Tax=Ascaphus truei TaxID=8439 RepID=UPI003F59B25F
MELPGAGTLLLLFFVTCLVSLFAWRNVKSRLNMPPGPTPLPLLGNLLQLDRKDIVKTLLRLSSQYGPVCTVYMGPNPVVVLNGYDAVREALLDNGEVFSSRGRIPIIEQAFKGYGVLFSNGERWKQLRRFSLSTLRNFGMGKRSIEERVQEEAKCLEDEFRKRKETPFDPTYVLSLAVSNVICSIVFGDRYDYEDEKFLSMLTLMRETFKILTSPWTQ